MSVPVGSKKLRRSQKRPCSGIIRRFHALVSADLLTSEVLPQSIGSSSTNAVLPATGDFRLWVLIGSLEDLLDIGPSLGDALVGQPGLEAKLQVELDCRQAIVVGPQVDVFVAGVKKATYDFRTDGASEAATLVIREGADKAHLLRK